MVKTDAGEYLAFAFIRGDPSLLTSAGPIIRKDWLDELGLSVPETMDEYYNVLKKFKEVKKVDFPYSGDLLTAGTWGLFMGAYGIVNGMHINDGKVIFGQAAPQYKEYLTTLNKWYKEGLIDKNFASLDTKTINSNMLNGFSGMTQGSGGGTLGLYLDTMKNKRAEFDLAGSPYPVLNKGDKPFYGQIQLPVPGNYVAVSTSCKNIPAAVRFLNYGYTEEGSMLFNFGIEGESYEMKDGYPTYSDIITNSPDDLPMNAAMAQYTLANSGGGAFVQDKRYIEQYYRLDRQKEAWNNWSDTDAITHIMPPVTISADQLTNVSKILNDVNTYANEMTYKFIMGTADLSEFDNYVSKLNQMGLQDAIKRYQDGYDRYQLR
jgi:putative aldouronate transport system substrate-binding protein